MMAPLALRDSRPRQEKDINVGEDSDFLECPSAGECDCVDRLKAANRVSSETHSEINISDTDM